MADDTSTSVTLASEQSREGPGNGGIPRSDIEAKKAEQSREGPGNGGISGSAKRGVKRKLDSKTLKEKYDAILEVEKGQKSKTEIAKMFNVPKNTLSGWVKKAESIKEGFEKFGPKRRNIKKGEYDELEDLILKWFTQMRDRDIPISGPLLLEKAKYFADSLDIKDFKQSTGWLDRFKERHGISFKKICGESKSVDSNSADMGDWSQQLKVILQTYAPKDIYNADETAMFYKLLPDKTLEFKSVDCKGGKRSKDRVTALVCSNMTGTDKLPLLVIGKSANPRCFKNVKTLPTSYQSNKKAWMTSEIFKNWLTKLDKKMQNKNRQICMIVDNCPAHPHVKGLKAVKLKFLPPNTTSQTQPMDQGVIKNLKTHYRKQVILRQLQAADKDEELKLSLLDGLRLFRQSWSMVTPTTIANCFRHANFVLPESNPEPTSDNDDSDDDIPLAQLQTHINSDINLQEYINVDAALPVCEEPTDDDLINEFKMNRNADQLDTPVDDDDDDDNEVPSKPPPSLSKVFEAANTLEEFYTAEDNCEEELALLNKLRQKLNQRDFKKRLAAKQCSIKDFV